MCDEGGYDKRLKARMPPHHAVPSERAPLKRSACAGPSTRRPSDAELRASAGRIVDLLQQLVIARPEMVLPLEQIMRGVLANFFVHLEEHERWRDDEVRSGRRTPLPRMPLSELPALKALLETNLPTSYDRLTRKIVMKKVMSRKRRENRLRDGWG